MSAAGPGCGVCRLLESPALYQDELWHVRHLAPPGAVAGWMLLIARRHVASLAELDDREARDLGPALRHFERVLARVTDAERIYTAALGEQHPHVHLHMVPRRAQMPRGTTGFAVFDLERAAASGEVAAATPAEVAAVSSAYADALAAEPYRRR